MKMAEGTPEVLNRILSAFLCKKDKDIEYFLHHKAVEFEQLSKSRTYIICDQQQIMDTDFCLEQLQIYGYVTMAIKVLTLQDEISNRKRKEIDGLSAKIHGKPIKYFPCYLIGQLARNSDVPDDSISGESLLHIAYDVTRLR